METALTSESVIALLTGVGIRLLKKRLRKCVMHMEQRHCKGHSKENFIFTKIGNTCARKALLALLPPSFLHVRKKHNSVTLLILTFPVYMDSKINFASVMLCCIL